MFAGVIEDWRRFPPEFSTLTRNRGPEWEKSRVVPSTLGPLPGRPRSENTIEDSAMSGAVARKRWDLAKEIDGKIQYFRNEGCSVPEREARSLFGPANTIEEVRHRIADCV